MKPFQNSTSGGKIARREFVRKVGFAIASGTVASVFAGCSSGGESDVTVSSTAPIGTATPAPKPAATPAPAPAPAPTPAATPAPAPAPAPAPTPAPAPAAASGQKIIIATVHAKVGSEGAVLNAGRKVVAATRKEPGCISYELLRNPEDPCRFVFVEQWKDQAAIAAHFETEHFKAFGKATEKDVESKKIVIYDIADKSAPGKKLIIAKFSAKVGSGDTVLDAGRRVVAETRREPGNISYELLRSIENPHHITFVEEWKDQAAIEAHFAAAHFKEFSGVLQQHAEEKSEIAIHGITGQRVE